MIGIEEDNVNVWFHSESLYIILRESDSPSYPQVKSLQKAHHFKNWMEKMQ